MHDQRTAVLRRDPDGSPIPRERPTPHGVTPALVVPLDEYFDMAHSLGASLLRLRDLEQQLERLGTPASR